MLTYLVRLPASLVMALQLLITGAIYCATLKRQPHFMLRLLPGICVFLMLSSLQTWLPDSLRLYIMPLIVYLLYTLLLFWLFDTGVKMNLFVLLSAIATQHMAVAATDTLRSVFQAPEDSAAWFFLCLPSFMLILPLCDYFYARQLRKIVQIKIQSVRLICMAFSLFALVYLLRVFSVSQLWYLPSGSPLPVTFNLYDLTGSLTCLAILYTGNHEDTLLEENQIIERLLHEREAQERQIGETIDLVNMKYHDMKHLVTAMRSCAPSEMTGMLDEIEREMPGYEQVLHTGNAALDTIVMNKMVRCQARHITLSCMVDGEKLSFLSSADICALFGNLLDNAMEAAEKEPEERRMITLQLFEKRGYVCIHTENYCAHPPTLKNGLPETDKPDRRFHGFGLRSIRYITEKYGGHLAISTDHERFRVDILLPVA